ncbi:MAG: tRNA 2-thiouridine(34) synthase MnmA [Candidatus Marinimicrobia bacterium CG08_land_8_20_14_0_20_45_22]|nr:MAG: tRNA 2-thiouridine(34) synthase MnmA [Candidatus Marinimicrobia bacterium CG08_land_8_20_14_0_20_45_22]
MNKRVVVAMSGGVDSSVAACLLAEKGFDVIGLTMRIGLPDLENGSHVGIGEQIIADAKRVADKLGIPHLVLDLGKQFHERVIANFINEYLAGRTPNPCVRCNEFLKFGDLLQKALALNADYLATGHYARNVRRNGVYYLKKAIDLKKDQSYFLYRLSQEKLQRILFPLGNFTKEQVRFIARNRELPVAKKPESQEICFISGSYRDFLASHLEHELEPGNIVDENGKFLGRHKGIPFYTIGQREGLNIACGYPVFVQSLDPKTNTIVVSRREGLMRTTFSVADAVYPSGILTGRTLLDVRIRHQSPASSAWVTPLSETTAEFVFKKPRFAITPGQSAVFYKRETVVGGGVIDKVIEQEK